LNFFKKCKCPKYQEFQSPDIGRGLLTVDNLTVRLEENRMRVLEGPVLRRAGSSQVFQEKTLIFQGKSIEETKATATASVPSGQDFSLDIQDVQTKTVEEKGESADAAIEAANAKIPSEAFDISSGEIINENHGQEGVLEIEGDAEWEARIQWKMSKPFLDGAQLLDMNCVREASKGFLGIGKRQSVWEARWSMPFIAQVSYKLPAVVRVRFYEEI
jgi:hypothetical protein